jgi:hypothetical protein
MRAQASTLARRARHPGRSARIARDASRLLLGLTQPKVVVLGNQKSGTSAVAALLARWAGLRATIDIPDLWMAEFVRLRSGATTLRAFAARHPREFSAGLVKEPNLTFLYPQVRRAFPRSSVVCVAREPRANIRSILSRLGLPGDENDLSPAQWNAVPRTWTTVLQPHALGVGEGTYVETLARRWNAAADAFLDHAGEMRLVRYEDFLRGKARTIAALADDLGLPARAEISASLDEQFQPRGSHVPFEQFFGPRNLRRVVELCRDRAARLGYDLEG